MLRVAIVEDHPMFRLALEALLSGEFVVVGTAPDLDSGRTLLATVSPIDVLLLDLGLPDGDGLNLLHQIRNMDDAPKVLVVSGSSDGSDVYAALEAGASGFLCKVVTGQDIVRAVNEVATGNIVLPAPLMSAVAHEIKSIPEREPVPVLTARERQILALAADGCKTAEIARRLHVSAATVKTQFGTMYERLGAPDRASAVATAIRTGLID